jgi:hypothetical protein
MISPAKNFPTVSSASASAWVPQGVVSNYHNLAARSMMLLRRREQRSVKVCRNLRLTSFEKPNVGMFLSAGSAWSPRKWLGKSSKSSSPGKYK